ncbi:MAG: transaldolase, partial [Gemmatimonadetes bacterium]|nr:transaldolase [Gemmatimonadota bacterium]
FEAIDRPNAMIKVPGTPEGMPAIYSLVSRGINVNVTLLFALSAYRRAAEAYIEGLQDYLRSRGERVARVASVASFFVSRVDTAVDRLLDGAAGKGHDAGAEAARLKGKAAVANAKLAYAEFQRIFGTGRFAALSRAGARVQRPLWASTSTKNPAYSPTLYVDPLVGPHTVNTMPPQTLDAFLERGPVEETITRGADGARAHMKALESVGIDMDAVADRLLQEGLKAFTDSYLSVVERVRHKCEALRRAAGTGRSA